MLGFCRRNHVLADGKGLIGQGLSLRPLVWLGEVSFALYMIHQILMKVLFLKFPEYSTAWMVIGICLLSAAVLHYGIEKPARAFLTIRRRSESKASSLVVRET